MQYIQLAYYLKNQEVEKHFKWLEKKYEKTVPQITIDDVTVSGGNLNFLVDNFKMEAAPGQL